MKDVEFRIHESYKSLDNTWNDIPTHSFLNPQQVSLAEISGIEDLEYRYVTVSYKRNVIAHIYFQILNVNKNHLRLESATWRYFSDLSLRTIRPRLLICGHLFRHDVRTVRFTDTSLSAYLQAKIIYEASMNLLAECHTTALLIKDLPQEYNRYFLHHAPKCKAMKEDITMGMKISGNWDTFDDYLNALKHKYKQRSKKIRSKAKNLNTRKLNIQELEHYGDLIEKYYFELLEKQMVKLGIINKEYLKNLILNEPSFSLFGIFGEQEELLGFYSCFEKENMIDMYFVGYDTAKNKTYNLYFNILFWGLELAIDQNKKYINMGRTALDPKASIGCEPSYSQNFYRIKNRLFNRISQRSQNRFLASQGEVWEIRRPFNNAYYQSLKNVELV